MRCLITGASGFVGNHLSTLLLAAGHEVFGACWPELPVDRSTRVELQLCNLMDPEVALELVRKAQPEWVFHLAGISSPIDSLSSPRPTLETYRYAMPGEPNVAQPVIEIFDVASLGRNDVHFEG